MAQMPRWVQDEVRTMRVKVARVPDDLPDRLGMLQAEVAACNAEIAALQARIAVLERKP